MLRHGRVKDVCVLCISPAFFGQRVLVCRHDSQFTADTNLVTHTSVATDFELTLLIQYSSTGARPPKKDMFIASS